MSESYRAIGWNRQKKIYDWCIAGFCLLYLAVFAGTTALVNPDYTFETLLIRSTSTLAILLLTLVLSIGPLARLNKRFLPLLYNRRHLGVTTFLVAATHALFSLNQFHFRGNVNPLVSLLTSNTNFRSVSAFPFQALGMLALVILFLMAATSHDFWLKNLSPKTWKALHMMVYLAYALVVMHVMTGVIQLESRPVYVLLVSAGALWLIIIHLLAGFREARKDSKNLNRVSADGFVDVGRVEGFEEGRAKIFSVNGERVAVFLHEGKLFAIHNECKHQGGPLGEGKIVDGCITCPWHGYQYFPKSGQSPPPFKEKVRTYALKIISGKLYIDPKLFEEGYEQPGADIQKSNE